MCVVYTCRFDSGNVGRRIQRTGVIICVTLVLLVITGARLCLDIRRLGIFSHTIASLASLVMTMRQLTSYFGTAPNAARLLVWHRCTKLLGGP